MKQGRYIYCIINDSEDRSFGPIGINDGEVNLIPYQDIAAVVSSSPVMDFDSLDRKELEKYVARHREVNKEVMKDYSVVPMSFGIIAPSQKEVVEILEKAYLQFKAAIEKVSGKAEFIVRTWWKPEQIIRKLVDDDSQLQQLKQRMDSRKSILAVPTKLRLGRLIKSKAQARKKDYIQDIRSVLGKVSTDSASSKLTEEDMIANLSFLVKVNEESELDAKMRELGQKYEGELEFKYIGPMPPYSFTEVNLKIDNFEVVNEARKRLNLPQVATFEEIKKAYYEFAHQHHPDKHQDQPQQAKNEMEEINRAYNVLENYCKSSAELAGEDFDPDQEYSFKEKDIKQSILIH